MHNPDREDATAHESSSTPGTSGTAVIYKGPLFGIITHDDNCAEIPNPRGRLEITFTKLDFWPGYESYFNSAGNDWGWLQEQFTRVDA